MGLVWTIVLNSLLFLAAHWVALFGLRQPRGVAHWLATALLGWVWLTLGMEILGTIGLLSRGPLLCWVGAGLTLGIFCKRFRPLELEQASVPSRWNWTEVIAVGLLIWATALYGVPSLFRGVKVVSDGPIYHLYFAARWWKAGQLALIAAPFGENAATYFPAIGDLWFSWLMISAGGDQIAKVGQMPFLLLAAITVVAICQRLGATRSSAVLATAWFVTSSPLFLFSFEPNVDTIFVAAYLVSFFFLMRFELDDDGLPSLFLCALASGAALGTKAPAIVFVPPLLFLGIVSILRKTTERSTKVVRSVVVIVAPCGVTGYWYLRNAILTGNPLYPLHLEAFGKVWLAGWYGPEVMKLSPYYMPITEWRALIDILLAVLDPRLVPFWLFALMGAWRWGKPARREYALVWICAGLAVLNVALYWFLIPYRTQQRFMLQALGLAAVPLALMFDRSRTIRVAAVVLLIVHLLTKASWPFSDGEPPWDLSRYVPNVVPGLIAFPSNPRQWLELTSRPQALLQQAVSLALGFASFATAFAILRLATGPEGMRNRRRLIEAIVALSILLTIGFGTLYPWGLDDRQRFFPRFPEYNRGWVELDLRSGTNGAKVAYAGNALPYYLMGVGLRNDVRYVNIDAHPGWLLHDYHREASRSGSSTWPHPRPGWDRLHPDYHAWLSNLHAEGIQILVVNRANPAEGPHNIADSASFPIERQWAEGHPESFTPLYGIAEQDPQFRIYRIR